MLSRSSNLLTPTGKTLAKLVAGSNTTPLTSVSPEFARTLPPVAPTTRPPPRRRPSSLPATEEVTRTLPSSSSSRPTRGVEESTLRQPIPVPETNQYESKATREHHLRGGNENPERDSLDRIGQMSVDDDVQLERFFLRTLNQLGRGGSPRSPTTTVQELVEASQAQAGTVLENVTLPYESTPNRDRRVRIDGRVVPPDAEGQDGIVLVAHVVGGKRPKVSISSGFAVGDPSPGDGAMILTCLHTLHQVEGHLSKIEAKGIDSPPSATFVLTSSGHAFAVTSLLSSLPASDLLLLRLSPHPVESSSLEASSSVILASTGLPPPRLRSLPINPYPFPTSTLISTHAYLNPLSRLARKLQKLPDREWQQGRIVEYKDSIGRTAEPGTYDELGSFWTSSIPGDGSSGGPIIEVETGSVVGVTRGSTHKYGERTRYGFATPAERILDMFALPGFKTTAQRQEVESESRKLDSAPSTTTVAPNEAAKRESK